MAQEVGFGGGGHGDISAQIGAIGWMAISFVTASDKAYVEILRRPVGRTQDDKVLLMRRLAVGTGLWRRKYGAEMGEIRRGYR